MMLLTCAIIYRNVMVDDVLMLMCIKHIANIATEARCGKDATEIQTVLLDLHMHLSDNVGKNTALDKVLLAI